MRARALRLGLLILLLGTGCSEKTTASDAVFDKRLKSALEAIDLTMDSLRVPRLGRPYSTPGRLTLVDRAMKYPPAMVDLSHRLLRDTTAAPLAPRVAALLSTLDIMKPAAAPALLASPEASDVWNKLAEASSESKAGRTPPAEWTQNTPLFRALRLILSAAADAGHTGKTAGGNATPSETVQIQRRISDALHSTEGKPQEYWLTPDEYHQIGARVNLPSLASALVRLLAAVEQALPDLREAARTASPQIETTPLEWDTPLGRVRLAGTGNDRHSGDFLLLIDLGGDDIYENVQRSPYPGTVSVVIDLSGNDRVHWQNSAGPGSGILGIGLWADLQGDDRYTGRNMGPGLGLLGAGLLWDAKGNDVYTSASMTQGIGLYGIGLLIDERGDDRYTAALNGQGFGSSGGVGVLMDLDGNDHYVCGGLVPDQAKARIKRHAGNHYLSMCQGYAFGIRPKISGGIGLLLDRRGDDHYQADLFAQGGAYWFGLGMLVDGGGNDDYQAFEHCQGESLHLGAGFLGDWGGNDNYTGYEHCQGVGMDRAAGILYDHAGNDSYRAEQASQGAGLKPYGVGLLIDTGGDDRYQSQQTSQGYSARPPQGFPESQWALGVLLDLDGKDQFLQPGAAPVTDGIRIQNRQGILFDE